MKRKLLSRKLQHTMLSLTASATVFAALLMAGTPASSDGDPATIAAVRLSDHGVTAAVDASDPSAAGDVDGMPAVVPHRRSLSRTRSLLALPYFSFAQGLRHTRS